MKIEEVIKVIEKIAPPAYQESYDNAGLLTGNKNWDVKGVLLTLDCTEAVVEEAVKKGCNLILAHHPVIFRGLKRLTGRTYVERTIIKAIRQDVSIYAAHTNLDNVLRGVNSMICRKLGIHHYSPLSARPGMLRLLNTFVPVAQAGRVRDALFEAGAGHVGNYSEASFNTQGTGTFKPGAGTHPTIGTIGEREKVEEVKIEAIFPGILQESILSAIRASHPYEEPAINILKMENSHQEIGSGMIGELESPMTEMDFLKKIKVSMQTGCIRYSPLLKRKIKRVAVCGGSGSFLLPEAIKAGADMYVTADFKYHEFFDAEDQIVIADIGHFESEQFTVELFEEILTEKIPNFAALKSEVHTNPINYLH